MKTLTFDFDNIGGIQHVYAIPAEVFQAITVNYATLRRALSMLSTTDVVKIPVFADESFSFRNPTAATNTATTGSLPSPVSSLPPPSTMPIS